MEYVIQTFNVCLAHAPKVRCEGDYIYDPCEYATVVSFAEHELVLKAAEDRYGLLKHEYMELAQAADDLAVIAVRLTGDNGHRTPLSEVLNMFGGEE